MGHRDPEEAIQEQQVDTAMRELGDRPAPATTPRYHHVVEHGATLRGERDAMWGYIGTLEDELRTLGILCGEVLLTAGPMLTIDERIGELRRQYGLVEGVLSGPPLADNR